MGGGKEVLEKFLSKEYPLTPEKLEKIIKEKKGKYIDIEKYQKFFLKYQSKKLMSKMKTTTSSKLSKAPNNIKAFFDDEAKEVSHISDDISEDEEEDGGSEQESNKSIILSDDDDDDDGDYSDDMKNNGKVSNISRKRKCEFSTLDDDNTTKKKEGLNLRWLPDGNKVRIYKKGLHTIQS